MALMQGSSRQVINMNIQKLVSEGKHPIEARVIAHRYAKNHKLGKREDLTSD